jgi:hypothetical protein
MDSPQNHIWGPQLWIILHSSAERIGSKQLQRLPQEESRIWTTLLSSLRYSLPCPQCKKHYSDYILSTPITSIAQPFIRNWIYNLHNQVNARTGKPNNITVDQISEIYSKPFNFSAHFSIVIQQMHKAVQFGWSSRNDIQKSIRLFEELKRFYDFF